MTNEAVYPKTNWKDVGLTALTTLLTAAIGCTAAVIIAQTLIIPAFNRAREKRLAAKDTKTKTV